MSGSNESGIGYWEGGWWGKESRMDLGNELPWRGRREGRDGVVVRTSWHARGPCSITSQDTHVCDVGVQTGL